MEITAASSQTLLFHSSFLRLMIMTQLGAWVKKYLCSKSNRKKQPAEKLPCFSSTRRPITPTSLENPTCLFFGLPGDIRSKILAMAFGGHTLHMDIVRQNKAWQWRGCVCNRNPPGLLPSMHYTWISPLNEQCPQYICERIEKVPESYSIGIMGFLLSCRQAYTEGIEFLYSTNCINVQSETLLLHLPQMILPSRSACIKALEIVIRVHRIQHDTGGSSPSLDHLKPILDHIVTSCYSLRSICISFASPNRGIRILNDIALPLLDAFHRSTQLRDMRVELPPDAYGAAFSFKSQDNSSPEAPLIGRFPRSIWRSLDSEVPMGLRMHLERYPYPPLRLPSLGRGNENIESVGYWLSVGFEETIRSPMVCF